MADLVQQGVYLGGQTRLAADDLLEGRKTGIDLHFPRSFLQISLQGLGLDGW